MEAHNTTVYIGFDSAQAIAHDVCVRSLRKYNNRIKITSLVKSHLTNQGLFHRENDSNASTEFTYTRFLVPFLNNYEGVAIFCDSDFLYKYDIEELLQFYDSSKAVMCVKHEQKCKSPIKFSGLPQKDYPRKNWTSLMIFNCSHPSCKNLNLKTINNATPKFLHQMEWCKDEEIGEIPFCYNYLLGYYHSNDAKAVHFTEGGPWNIEWHNSMLPKECIHEIYGDEWMSYLTHDEKKKILKYNL